MNIKKEAFERIVAKLEAEKSVIECKEIQIRRQINSLVREQTIIKREKAAIHNLINEIRKK